MKYAAIFMIVLVVIGLGLGVYTYANAHLSLMEVSMSAARGFERAADFSALQAAMDQGALLGTAFADSLPGSNMDYTFETYTFRLRNPGLIDAEMVEITPLPAEGDMLAFATLDAAQVNANLTVPAGSERDAWCTLLVSANQDELTRYQRRFRVTYYIWGMQKTETVRYQQ